MLLLKVYLDSNNSITKSDHNIWSGTNMIDHDVYTNQNVNVCTDASSMTRWVQLNQTKWTSSKSSKEEKQICDIITSYDNFIETQSNQKLPKRLYSLEEMNKDHKQYIKLIKSKVSKLNACELLTQSQIRLRNPKTSHSQTRKALKRKWNVSTKSKLLCKSEIKVKRRSQRDGVKILIKNSQSNESDRCICKTLNTYNFMNINNFFNAIPSPKMFNS